jgi:hypothetical protein
VAYGWHLRLELDARVGGPVLKCPKCDCVFSFKTPKTLMLPANIFCPCCMAFVDVVTRGGYHL